MIGRHYAFIHKLLHLVLPEQVTTHCTSMVSLPMQEQRDLLVLLVESEVDVDELGEKATLRIMIIRIGISWRRTSEGTRE